MIRHCVMLRLAPDKDPDALDRVYAGLSDLVERLDGCSGFVSGPNLDLEGRSVGFPSGFTLDAEDAAALQRYGEHPEHQALSAQLVALCDGGVEGIMVFDIERVQ